MSGGLKALAVATVAAALIAAYQTGRVGIRAVPEEPILDASDATFTGPTGFRFDSGLAEDAEDAEDLVTLCWDEAEMLAATPRDELRLERPKPGSGGCTWRVVVGWVEP
jgi:hypothetical protein